MITSLIYLLAAICFILSVQNLTKKETVRRGNNLGLFSMGLVIWATLSMPPLHHSLLILTIIACGGLAGGMLARKIRLNAFPELLAIFHLFIGLSVILVTWCILTLPHTFHLGNAAEFTPLLRLKIGLSLLLGAITSMAAIHLIFKLEGLLSTQREQILLFLLNTYSGFAIAAIGFTIRNHLLILAGGVISACGLALSRRVSEKMNRTLISILIKDIDNHSHLG